MSVITTAALALAFVAGKSGGHILPCLTTAEKMHHKNPQVELYLFTTGTPLENKIINKHPHVQQVVPATLSDAPGYKIWLWPRFCWQMLCYFKNSYAYLKQHTPEKVISYGGLNSIPVCLAAKWLHIPFELHELNVEPGKAITFLSYFTDTIHICFQATKKYFPKKKCILEPYPIRFTQNVERTNELYAKYNLVPTKKTILILGGSQGSQWLNETACKALCSMPDAHTIQIIHQTGNQDSQTFTPAYQAADIHGITFSFTHNLEVFYALADCVICRSGAGTLFECMHFKKPCITIPLEVAGNNHQVANAYAIQEMYPHACKVIEQKDFSVKILQDACHRYCYTP